MTTDVLMVAVAGLACSAGVVSAQPNVPLHFTLDGDPLSTGDRVYDGSPATWTVFASFTGYPDPQAYFGGFVGSFSADLRFDGTLSGSVGNLTNLMAGEGTTPTTDGTTIENINIFNNALLGTDDPSNPIAIFAFDMTVDGVTSLDPDQPLGVRYTAQGFANMFANSDIFTLFDEFPQFSIISDTLFVPGGGAGAVLGLGVLVSAGRRRRTGGAES